MYLLHDTGAGRVGSEAVTSPWALALKGCKADPKSVLFPAVRLERAEHRAEQAMVSQPVHRKRTGGGQGAAVYTNVLHLKQTKLLDQWGKLEKDHLLN